MNYGMNYSVVKKIVIFCFAPFLMALSGCSVKYSTSGASVNEAVKTASVQYFINKAPLGNPKLAQLLTEKLKDKILSQTSLKIVNGVGDVNLEGSISDYGTKPMAVQGGNTATAALNRLEVRVRMKYNNTKDGQYDYDTEFSRYKDYDSNMSVNAAEDQYLEKEIVDKLVEDIFNKAFVNW
jgi:hypothetical protein